MTQNASDVEIANQGFAAFRQDLNDVLEDITTLHSGTAAPSTTYANQWWYETDTDKLYIRNEDNDAWIEILTLDQANDHLASLGASITLDGTGNVSIDSGDFTVDTDTLFVDASADAVGISTSSPRTNLHVSGLTSDDDPALGSSTAPFLVTNTANSYGLNIGVNNQGDAWLQAQSNTASTAYDILLNPLGGNVGIGTTSPSADLHVSGSGAQKIDVTDTGGASVRLSTASGNGYVGTTTNHAQLFLTNDAERMRLTTSGSLLFAKNTSSYTNVGIEFDQNTGRSFFTVAGQYTTIFNRKTNDGIVIYIAQDSTLEGSISVSGTTVSYNGGHLARWSQLTDGTKDETIVKGTVMTNLDQMAVWSHDAVEAVEAQDAVYDDDGNVVTEAVEAVEAKDAYTEDNEQLNCMAVSSIEGDPNVAGVFVNWDNDDDEFNDMNIAMTGDMVIRVAQGTTVARGDLLMSAGDGTAKPQGDDIVRSKTIAKVTSTNVSHTYDDGSYCVPCVLMAC